MTRLWEHLVIKSQLHPYGDALIEESWHECPFCCDGTCDKCQECLHIEWLEGLILDEELGERIHEVA